MGPSCAPVTRCHRFSVVSISLQEAAKGLQEVEEIPDFFRRADGKMGKRSGYGQKLGVHGIKMEYSINKYSCKVVPQIVGSVEIDWVDLVLVIITSSQFNGCPASSRPTMTHRIWLRVLLALLLKGGTFATRTAPPRRKRCRATGLLQVAWCWRNVPWLK